jgi:hypothetical protein
MGGQKILDLKLAAKDLIDIVVWDDQSQYTSKVAIAPFSADVRLPADWNLAARGNRPATIGGGQYACPTQSNPNKMCNNPTYTLSPCVAERTGVNKYTDAAPAGPNDFVMGVYNSNGTCNQSTDDEVSALSANKTTLKTKIDSLDLGGGTSGHLGTAWAWYTLSPNWASVFPAAGAPKPYGTAELQKIAILMTDGEYNEEYGADGRTSSNSNPPANDGSVNQAKALCDGMKAKGITVYTVGFQLPNQLAIDTMNYCATDSTKAYNAASGDELRQAFRDIALKISDLYLSQ